MKNFMSEDSIERTLSACAWLIDVAQRSVDLYGWDPVIVRYLEQLGQGAYAAQLNGHGGMGAVDPIERSAAAVELLAYTGAIRVSSIPKTKASAARLDRQIGVCACAGRVASTGVAR